MPTNSDPDTRSPDPKDPKRPPRTPTETSPAGPTMSDFRDHIVRVVEETAYETWDEGNPSEGEYRSKLWDFTRKLKAWCQEGTDPMAVFKVAEPIVLKMGGWDDLYSLDHEVAPLEFERTWGKIRLLEGQEPLQAALLKAMAYKMTGPNAEKRDRPMPGYDRFLSFVGALQFIVGDRPFYLPVRDVAKALGTDRQTISLWRRLALKEGLLELVAEHEFRSQGGSKATEFRMPEKFASQYKRFMTQKKAG